jgi:hypothetical protein
MARKKGAAYNFQLSMEHRSKIKAAQIINALEEHTLGLGRKMSQTQVTAGVALLRKVIPDLMATSIEGKTEHTHRVIITGVRRAGDLPAPALKVINGSPRASEDSGD